MPYFWSDEHFRSYALEVVVFPTVTICPQYLFSSSPISVYINVLPGWLSWKTLTWIVSPENERVHLHLILNALQNSGVVFCFVFCKLDIAFCKIPLLQNHDFPEETLDLVTEVSLNLSDSQSTGKGLRKDQSLSFQLELFHYSRMWHNYKRCWMWNLIRIIWHSSLLKKSPQLLLW